MKEILLLILLVSIGCKQQEIRLSPLQENEILPLDKNATLTKIAFGKHVQPSAEPPGRKEFDGQGMHVYVPTVTPVEMSN